MMSIEYTRYLEQQIAGFEISDEDTDTSYADVLQFLNDTESFAPFGERLDRFIRENCDVLGHDSKAYLRRAFRAHGIEPVKNTLNNWFSDRGPKKGDGGRESILQIAFMLDLDVNSTNLLLNKVYLDRDLDCRNPSEFIIRYCLENKLTWQTAQEMIQQCELTKDASDITVSTQHLSDAQQVLSSDKEVLRYISEHSHNFRLRYRSALQQRDELLLKVRGTGNNDGEIDRELAEIPEIQKIREKRKKGSWEIADDIPELDRVESIYGKKHRGSNEQKYNS